MGTVKGVYKAGRMTSGGKIEDDSKKPAGESQGKYEARKQAQSEGARMYTRNGKTEYAGTQENMGGLPNKSTVSISRTTADPGIPGKIESSEPTKTAAKTTKIVGRMKPKASTVERQRAPGLGGSNTLRQKY